MSTRYHYQAYLIHRRQQPTTFLNFDVRELRRGWRLAPDHRFQSILSETLYLHYEMFIQKDRRAKNAEAIWANYLLKNGSYMYDCLVLKLQLHRSKEMSTFSE